MCYVLFDNFFLIFSLIYLYCFEDSRILLDLLIRVFTLHLHMFGLFQSRLLQLDIEKQFYFIPNIKKDIVFIIIVNHSANLIRKSIHYLPFL